MNSFDFSFHGAQLSARPAGTLWWGAERMLVVSDLHLGKSERMGRNGGALLPPYEVQDTLERLEAEINATGARVVVCLGDSFDDREAAEALDEDVQLWITRLQAGRDWLWVEGNHDPGPVGLGGAHLNAVRREGLTFRHIAEPGEKAEISGHYHPKASVKGTSRPAFLIDTSRIIMPAFGTYTGGLRSTSEALDDLMEDDALAVLTGQRALPVPMRQGLQRRRA